MSGSLPARRVGVTTVVGGLLWIVHGPLTMLQPWGRDVVYSVEHGYSLIDDATSFLLYNAPGSLAVILSAAGAIGILRPVSRGRVTQRLVRPLLLAALGLGLLSLAGVALLIDPLYTAGRIAGTLALGVAVLAAWRAAVVAGAPAGEVWPLLAVGALGVFLLPLWPLVFALQWVSPHVGAVVIAAFGLGWVWLGARLSPGEVRPRPRSALRSTPSSASSSSGSPRATSGRPDPGPA